MHATAPLASLVRAPKGYDASELLRPGPIVDLVRLHQPAAPFSRVQLWPNKVGSQLVLFLSEISKVLAAEDLHLIDAVLWIKEGDTQLPTRYHNDPWFTVGLDKRVLQLWLPLFCRGSKEAVSRTMLRIDTEDPCPEGWGCPPGADAYLQMWTGDRREYKFKHKSGILSEDVRGAFGGGAMEVGDMLLFDNAYCHYSLHSDALRISLAIRLVCGQPSHNGYFNLPRPLDGNSVSERNRKSFASVLAGREEGKPIPPADLLWRDSQAGLTATTAIDEFIRADGAGQVLLPHHVRYAEHLAGQIVCRRPAG